MPQETSMPHQPVPPQIRPRLARLDGLRGLAALGVMLYHIAFYHPVIAALPFRPGPVLGWIATSGWSLVDLFFVLSGYVFAHVYGAPGLLRRPGAVGDFWVARLARLWPLHALTLGLVAVFAWGGRNDMPHLLLQLPLLQVLDIEALRSFNTVSWSLSIEIMAYALFVIGAWAGDRVLLWISVLAVVGSTWWLVIVGIPDGPWLGEVIPRGLLGFFMGQLLWRGRGWAARCPWPVPAMALAGALWLQRGNYSPLLPMGLLGWPAAVLLALRLPLLERGAIAWLGERSFGVYMVHLPIIRAIDATIMPHLRGAAGFWWGQAGSVIVVLLCADAAYRLVEMPARRAIRAAWAERSWTLPRISFSPRPS